MGRALQVKISDQFRPAAAMVHSPNWQSPFVYIIRANRKQRRDRFGLRYQKGGSRILYIGTTKRGGRTRGAYSLAGVAEEAFGKLHGVKELHVHLVRCRAKRHINMHLQLESALLRSFREIYGHLPYFNKNRGAKPAAKRQFTPSRLRNLLHDLS